MRVPAAHSRADISENMMTSMIDVVFLLLIFFVCAAVGQISESLLPTDLAAEGGVASTAARAVERNLDLDEIWVGLRSDAAGRLGLELNGRTLADFAELHATLLALAEVQPENPVVLDIDGGVEAGDMVRAYDTCRAARFQSINFNVRPASRGPRK